jgi:fructose-bisphosphate aldolase/6-deoxy-5-ketofructose 1-phosphate synthase
LEAGAGKFEVLGFGLALEGKGGAGDYRGDTEEETMTTITKVDVPADVPSRLMSEYEHNWQTMTKGTGRLMLFAGDQKVEHLNDDFYGTLSNGTPIHEHDADPEHLFRIARDGVIGCFATQLGLIARYGRDYASVPYLVKLNSKSHLIKTSQRDPQSLGWATVEDALTLREAGLTVVGVGYTVYLGSQFESEQMREAAQACFKAHRNGMLAVLWIYPRGTAVPDETDPHLIAGATGLGATLGADFCKVNYPKPKEGSPAESFREAVAAAGRTRVITAGGGSTDVRKFLQTLHDQIFIAGAHGSATGRNIHQKTLDEAVRMTNAISAITYGGQSVDDAMAVYEGRTALSL